MEAPEKRRRGRPRTFMPSPEASTVQALDRGLSVLASVARGDGLSLTEIAEATGLAAPTVYRMLTTLEGHGMVEFDKTDQLWSIGVDTYRMGAAFLRRRKLVDRARGVMQDLVEQTGETANLGVAEEDCVVFVTQVETHQAIRAFFRPGSRSPLHASGIGKAILSHRPATLVRAMAVKGLETYTPRTLVDSEQLALNLAKARDAGFAVDDEERHLGMRCVAAAIFDEYGRAIGGVSVSGPTVRMTPERVAEVGPLIRDAAVRITAQIGGASPDDIRGPRR